jgi:anti-sigma factor RsiW
MSQITELDIQAYIDGALDEPARRRVDDACETDELLARRIRDLQGDMALLRRYFDAASDRIGDERIADTVRLIVDHAPSPRRRIMAGLHFSLRTAAMVALVVVGALGVFGVKVSMTVPAYADAAAIAYLDSARETVGEDELLAPENLIDWINNNTGLAIHVPFTEEHGYQLAEGKLTWFDDHAAGLLVYEDDRRHRVSIFVTRVRGDLDEERHFAVDRSVYINYRARNGIGIVIAAADRKDLDEFTRGAERLIDVSFPAIRRVLR